MNTQEAFDKIHAATRTQRSRAIDSNRKCVFRAPNGDRCFIGMLLSEDQAIRATEGSWSLGVIMETIDFNGSYATLLDLMVIHDSAEPAAWDDELKKLAARCDGVTYPPKEPT